MGPVRGARASFRLSSVCSRRAFAAVRARSESGRGRAAALSSHGPSRTSTFALRAPPHRLPLLGATSQTDHMLDAPAQAPTYRALLLDTISTTDHMLALPRARTQDSRKQAGAP